MKTISKILLFTVIYLFVLSCQDTTEEDCQWISVDSVVVDNILKGKLDNVFSKTPQLANNEENPTLYVIDNLEDFLKLSIDMEADIEAQIDFNEQVIIWGRVRTPSISDKIVYMQLSQCSTSAEWKYEIEIEMCTECWAATGEHFYWNVYPLKVKKENVVLIVK